MKRARYSPLLPSLSTGFALAVLTCGSAYSNTTEIFKTVGTTNWVCPPGVTTIQVECWGGGGAGGSSFVSAEGTANAGGGGGGGGAYARMNEVPVTPGMTYVITIPAAATSPATGFANSARYDGSAVSFTGDDDVTVTANGGQGGQCRIVTGATASSGGNGAGGAAGEGLDDAFAGGNSAQWGGGNGNGGGGGAGDLGNGGGALAVNATFGAGGEGSSPERKGGNGGASRNGAGTGNDAASPGGGGGGAKSTTTSKTSRRGGNGGIGQIILTYTIPPPATIAKADNSDDLNLGSSWVGGTPPSTLEVAQWDNTVSAANTTSLGADLAWAGIAITNPGGPVTLGGSNTLTLGSAQLDVDLSNATADLTLNCDILLGDPNLWQIASGRTLTLGGAVSGNFPLGILGTGTVRLNGPDLLPGGPDNGNVTLDANLDLHGNSQTLNGLSGSGVIDTTAAGASVTLTVGANHQSGTFSGVIQNSVGTLNLVKTGTGTQTLGGANTLAGSVTIEGGKLSLGNTAPLDEISGITMAAGTRLGPVGGDVVLHAPITLAAGGGDVTINGHSAASSTGTTSIPFTLDGPITGDGNLIFAGIESTNDYGRIILNAASDYTGSTLITTFSDTNNANLFLQLGVENTLPVTTVLTLDGGVGTGTTPRFCELNLAGNNQTLAGIQNIPGLTLRTQQIVNTSSTPATLTVNNADPFTYSARIGGGGSGNNLGLTKSGPGTLTLAGSNTYNGPTTITGGNLALAASNVLADTSAVSLGNGTLSIGDGFFDILDRLDVTGSATIHLGEGAALSFADTGDLLDWSGTLSLTGDFVSGSSLQFGSDASGLTAAQLARISSNGFTGFALNDAGFLTASEVVGGYSTWAAANAGGQGPELDFDNDGTTNGIEYFLNAPAGFTAKPALDAANTITWVNGGNLPASAYGTRFVIQTSSNLVDWADVPVGELASNTDGPEGTLRYTLSGASPRFVRLMVNPE